MSPSTKKVEAFWSRLADLFLYRLGGSWRRERSFPSEGP